MKKAKKTTLAKTKKTPNSKAKSNKTKAKTKALLLGTIKRKKTTFSANNKSTKDISSIGFTMDDVKGVLKERKDAVKKVKKPDKPKKKKSVKKIKTAPVINDVAVEHRNHATASLADVLGFNPNEEKKEIDHTKIPKAYKKYYNALIELRRRVRAGLDMHVSYTLKRSNKDDSGDLSSYGQHMADAGTDSFDRDFALSLVSSEQELLYEIEEAIYRISNNNYGICEITGKKIPAQRLEAVPFTRYSLEGQKELERNKRNKVQGGSVFSQEGGFLSFGEENEDN